MFRKANSNGFNIRLVRNVTNSPSEMLNAIFDKFRIQYLSLNPTNPSAAKITT